MTKPVLVVMAAGMGSRYGGLKQIDPVGKNGEIIMDYSVFDAYRAGFRDIIFIIKEELLETFEQTVGKRAKKLMNVSYVFQGLDKYTGNLCPENRVKPFGTGHAVLCTKEILDAPFAVINADDFYGAQAFKLIFDFLSAEKTTDKYEFAMVGYKIENTLTENGYVSRGVCKTDEKSMLTEIIERTQIELIEGKAQFTEDGGKNYTEIPFGTPVSMNMWGFSADFLNELESKFDIFLNEKLSENPEKAEFFLPFAVDELVCDDKATVKVLKTDDKWFGVTYKEDKVEIVSAIAKMTEDGLYDGI
ncbi:MAG: sugar phosphate nucleotidyltransferase [Clostridia bacterium]